MQSSNKYKFSVIIPVYNVVDYLKECIDSILAQTYKDYEIVLVDDGSSDGSEKLCDEYASLHDNILVHHKKNGGQSSARNIGTKIANGEYFIFVDSDDVIAADTLEQFHDKIRQYGQLDLILSESIYNIEPDGHIIDIQTKLNPTEYEGITGEQALKKMYLSVPNWSPCGKCYRTAYWREKGFRFLEGRISEDLQLIDRVILEANKVAMIKAHYYYRWKIQSSTMHKNFAKLIRDTIFVIDDWNSYLISKALDKELDFAIRASLANMLEHTVMGNIFYVAKDERKELIAGVKNVLYFLKYDLSAEGRLIRAACGIIGVRNTCFLLNKVKTARKKKADFV